MLESPSYNSLMIQLQFAQVGRVWRVQHIIILDDLLKEWGLTLKIKLHVAGDTDADDMRPLRLDGGEVECVTELSTWGPLLKPKEG